ncbi:MAG: AAA family ATPase, partial [Desulfamplus sp.]|nr:AAA family ATPase [Desulfamplus sp.]
MPAKPSDILSGISGVSGTSGLSGIDGIPGASGSMISNTMSGISGSMTSNTMISRAVWEESILESSDLVVKGPGNTPMVLDNGRLYLRRYWQYTVDVANDISRRLQLSFPVPDNLGSRLDELFVHLRSENERNKTEIHWQSVATALAAKGGFTIISGGPGTGKTTTVVQILALLQSMAVEQGQSMAVEQGQSMAVEQGQSMAMERGQKLRIHLAAPTGKAAA